MKRLYFLFSFFLIVIVSNAQTYPINQNLGRTASTLVSTNSIRADQGFIFGHFTDTTQANLLPYLKNYPYALITVDTNVVLMRDRTATRWMYIPVEGQIVNGDTIHYLINVSRRPGSDSVYGKYYNGFTSYETFQFIDSTGGGASTDAWKLTGNTGTNPATNFLGTVNAADLVVKTNNTEKLRIESGGNATFTNDVYVNSLFLSDPSSASTPYASLSSNAHKLMFTSSYPIPIADRTQTLDFSLGSANRVYTFQNGDGTLAFLSDIVPPVPDNLQGVTDAGNTTTNDIVVATTVTIGRGLTSQTNNLAIGVAPLAAITTGTANTGIGYLALNATEDGGGNTAVGSTALASNTSGDNNTAIGTGTLVTNVSSDNNTAVGGNALNLTVSGNGNNTAIGAGSMAKNTTGFYNTAVGFNSLNGNLTGEQNAAFGMNALLIATTAIKNTAIGAGSMEATTTGGFNTGIGHDALLQNVSGTHNNGLGWLALAANDTGHYNIGIGASAGRTMDGGNYNIFIGHEAGFNVSQLITADNSIAIGAGTYTTADNQIILGNASILETRLRGAIYFNGSAGTSGQVLTSAGTGGPPTWSSTATIGIPISSLTAATGANDINNGNNEQQWRWNSLVDGGLVLYSNSTAASTSGQVVLQVDLSGTNAAAGRTTYGAQIYNQHDGATSTNVGLFVSATNGTSGNSAIIVPTGGGSVGIGTSTPTQLLEVAGNIKYTGQIASTKQTVTYGTTTTWDWNAGTNAEVTLTGNITTFTITNAVAGTYATIRMIQDGTGSRLLSALPSGSKVFNGGAGAITLSTAANAIDLLTVYYDGTNYYWNYALNYN